MKTTKPMLLCLLWLCHFYYAQAQCCQTNGSLYLPSNPLPPGSPFFLHEETGNEFSTGYDRAEFFGSGCTGASKGWYRFLLRENLKGADRNSTAFPVSIVFERSFPEACAPVFKRCKLDLLSPPVDRRADNLPGGKVAARSGTNRNGKNSKQHSYSGEEPRLTSKLVVYPNPVRGLLTLSAIDTHEFDKMAVLSMQGTVVVQGSITGPVMKLDTHQWPEGVYLLLLRSRNNLNERTIKFVVSQ